MSLAPRASTYNGLHISNLAKPAGASQVRPPAAVDLQALQSASQVIQEQLVKDSQIVPDLGETLSTTAGPSSASYSTLVPNDYRMPCQKRRLKSIPEGLFEYYSHANVVSHMGIIPEIERVWVAIDHKLFLWDYVEGNEISSFVDQPHIISHVAAVKPKPGVFVEDISHILVICTPVSVLLIGLSWTSLSGPSNRIHKEIKLYATDMSVSTSVEMKSVIGTADGRIFMSGVEDGNLYELHYQESESWFGKRVQLINHSIGGVQSLFPKFTSTASEDNIVSVVSDLERSCFYTLTAKNNISVYRPNGDKSIQHIQTLTNLYKAAQDKAPGSPAISPQYFQIISLHIIEERESRSGIHLMAITSNGVRLYFSPSVYNYSYGQSNGNTGGAKSLQLMHVRLPPVNLMHPDEQFRAQRTSIGAYGTPQAPPQPPSRPYIVQNLESSCYFEGLVVATQQGDTDGCDFLLCMAPDLSRIGSFGQVQVPQPHIQPAYYGAPQYGSSGPSRPPLSELPCLLNLPHRTWAMAVVPPASPSTRVSSAPIPSVNNELATQFSEPPRQIMILTDGGIHFLYKRRALDFLVTAIDESLTEGNPQPVHVFRDSFGRDQTCAMLLGLASGNNFVDMVDSPDGTGLSSLSLESLNVARQCFYDLGQRPTWTERGAYGTGEPQGDVTYSGRREGFALYFARLVRPLWKEKLIKPGSLTCNVADDLLVTVQKNLYGLKEFLDKNPHLFHSSPAESGGSRSTVPVNEQKAWEAEQRSVLQLQALLTRTIEAISFVLLLTDYSLKDLIAHCEPEIQKTIGSLTFEGLITNQNGMTASRALVNVVIDQQIGHQISVDTISEVLQQRCGSFCSTDDVMLYKAKENIRKAVETRNATERRDWLGESLRLFVKGARILEFEKLREICGDYQQLSYARGAVELPLMCAQVLDADSVGLEYWYSGQHPPDQRKAELCDRRVQCYELILDSLRAFEDASSAAVAAAGVVPLDDPETVRTHAYELAFSNEDEMFHATLYDWLIERSLADELLEMRPAFLEAHLRRDPPTILKLQLLWQFYVKDGQPLRAAEVLATLAESTAFDLLLDARLEYLTLAVGNAKSHPISAGGRHETAIAFLTDLEEKLDVAQVQLEIYNALQGPSVEEGEKIGLLAKRLFTMSELYQLYAEPFNLLTMKLLIFHVSEHRDETLVRPIWNRIFEDILDEDLDPSTTADHIIAKVVPLGQRFYPSEGAFPLRHVASLLVRFGLSNKGVLPYGWAPRILIQCGVPYSDIWDVFHEMYESQIPPFNEQANVQAISSDIAVLLADWLEEARRPPQSSNVGRGEFPVGRIDMAVDQYLSELENGREETKTVYEGVKRGLRRNW